MKNKTKYVDGFVLLIDKKKVDAYRKIAKDAGKIWMKYGALSYKECILDNPKPEHIILTFPKLTKAKKNETVWFSYIEYKSKKHRDDVTKKVMEDDYMNSGMDKEMPFDLKKMSYGGFSVEVGY